MAVEDREGTGAPAETDEQDSSEEKNGSSEKDDSYYQRKIKDLNEESARRRVKIKELTDEIERLKTEASKGGDTHLRELVERMKTEATDKARAADEWRARVTSSLVDARLRAELATLGVLDTARQDILLASLRASSGLTLADDGTLQGDPSEAVKSAVDLTGWASQGKAGSATGAGAANFLSAQLPSKDDEKEDEDPSVAFRKALRGVSFKR